MTQPDDIPERLDAGDAAVHRGVSYNELHAVVVGSVLGVLAGRLNKPGVTLALAVGFVVPWPRGIGLKTLAREPWYTLGAYLIGVLTMTGIQDP